ncbi:hypothetical protein OUZ56_031449 [Daphnia magna]|uniref:Uncharacterized protein n=1 Tax=Daphnia magna TaxID=35525 RepID=A0ABQ9ZVE3_9CRUS|nr:hypothetical protein OUZ56_031449 [Daphnia magna]
MEGLEPVSIIRGAPILKKPLTPQRPQVHLLPPPGSKSMIAWILEKTMLGKRLGVANVIQSYSTLYIKPVEKDAPGWTLFLQLKMNGHSSFIALMQDATTI